LDFGLGTFAELLIVRDGMKLVGVGTAIGLAAAFVLTKVMSSLLFGVGPTEAPTVTPTDAFTFATVSIGALACYIPARRATKVDPLVALRNDDFLLRLRRKGQHKVSHPTGGQYTGPLESSSSDVVGLSNK
jgi:predicted lysophospholipase L1 biosynthesis ABC-type transport system permease subunit